MIEKFFSFPHPGKRRSYRPFAGRMAYPAHLFLGIFQNRENTIGHIGGNRCRQATTSPDAKCCACLFNFDHRAKAPLVLQGAPQILPHLMGQTSLTDITRTDQKDFGAYVKARWGLSVQNATARVPFQMPRLFHPAPPSQNAAAKAGPKACDLKLWYTTNGIRASDCQTSAQSGRLCSHCPPGLRNVRWLSCLLHAPSRARACSRQHAHAYRR